MAANKCGFLLAWIGAAVLGMQGRSLAVRLLIALQSRNDFAPASISLHSTALAVTSSIRRDLLGPLREREFVDTLPRRDIVWQTTRRQQLFDRYIVAKRTRNLSCDVVVPSTRQLTSLSLQLLSPPEIPPPRRLRLPDQGAASNSMISLPPPN
jgi:hypothetical protein